MTKDHESALMAQVTAQWAVALRRTPRGEGRAEGIGQESGRRLGDFIDYVHKHAKSAPVYLAPAAEA